MSWAKSESYYTVRSEPLQVSQYYTGHILPIREQVIQSHVNGVIARAQVAYGDVVTAQQPLLALKSTQLESALLTAKTALLKAKEVVATYENWEGSTELYDARQALSRMTYLYHRAKENYESQLRLNKLGLISDNERHIAEDRLKEREFDMARATHRLQEVASKGQGREKEVAQVTLAAAESEYQQLHQKQAHLSLKAPFAGVVLKPQVSDDTGSRGLQLTQGEVVTEDTPLLSVGDLSGIKVVFWVNELQVNQIAPDQTVMIQPTALEGANFKGKVTHVSSQASDSQSQPRYQITAEVSAMPSQWRSKLHVGMSAEISVQIVSKAHSLMVPLQYVFQENDQQCVWVVDKHHKKRKARIKTGYTTMTSVEVLQGLSEGERLAVPDQEAEH